MLSQPIEPTIEVRVYTLGQHVLTPLGWGSVAGYVRYHGGRVKKVIVEINEEIYYFDPVEVT